MSDYNLNEEKSFLGFFGRWWVILIIVFFVLGIVGMFVGGEASLIYQKTFGVAQENVKTQQFHQTASYQKGTADRLSALCGQVDKTDPDHKAMLYDQIAHEFSDVNTTDVPDYLQPCLAKARQQ